MSPALLKLIGLRILQAIPVLLGASFLVFSILNVLPGGTVAQILGLQSTPSLVHELTIRLGLNHPFLQRYFHWLWQALHLNFGTSLTTSQSVNQIVANRVPVSVELGLVAFAEALLLAVPVAILAARRPKGVIDRINIVVSMVGYSCPTFVTALVLILIFSVHLHLLPSIGFVPLSSGLWPNLKTLIMPSAAIALGIFAGYTRLLRADIVDQMNQEDYIVTARAKGVRAWRILVVHAFRNSLFGLITVVALNVGLLLSGAVIIETIFDIPGMGQEFLSAINSRDVPTVQAVTTLVGAAVISSNLLADILYSLLDPRIRYGRSSN